MFPCLNFRWPPGAGVAEIGRLVMKKRTLLVMVPVLLLLAACGQPVPQEKAAYVGEWRAHTMTLRLTQNGTVAYKRLTDGVTTSINGRLRRFEGDNFVVGVQIISRTFEV